jgi:hypothetical protein
MKIVHGSLLKMAHDSGTTKAEPRPNPKRPPLTLGDLNRMFTEMFRRKEEKEE